ncbi:MAG TPA: type II toxin-antitoxin system PemK/MazF family toxin [Candidatus Saccharimonadales bacterium]
MPSKDYTTWHTRKTLINSSSSQVYFYEREVWWVAIGQNVGDEEDGKGHSFARPVLILRKFNRSLFYGLPLSTAQKRGKYYYGLTIRGKRNVALLSHMRDYDSKRLIDRLAVISETEYVRIQLALIMLLKEPARSRL